MRKILLFLIMVLIITALTGCNDTSTNNDVTSQDTSVSENTTEEQTTNDIIIVEPDADEETTSAENVTEIIEENPFSYKFQFIDDEKTFFYVAPISGIYRFDMITDNVETNYKLKVYDSINQEIIDTEYNTYQHGETKELKKDETYRIVLSQYEGFPKATIKIGIPNETKIITGNNISGKLTYIGQEDNYTYKTNVSGYYRFDFSITNVKCDYSFILKDEINDTLIDTKYSTYTNGANKYLESGKEYTIKVIQNEGYVDYGIKIIEPQKPQKVNKSFSGEISFIGQENIYYFTPKSTGTYNIYISFGNKKGDCNLLLRDEKNQELITTSSEYPNKVELKKGKKYTFVVSYDNLLMDYDVIIELI